MQSLPGELRNQLAATVKAARRVGEAGARNALAVLAVGDARPHGSLSPDGQDLRRRLRAHGRQLGDRRDAETGVQQVERLVQEVAYEHWHRMLFARFLAESDLLIEPESGVPVSLTDCEELARERGQDRWTVAGRFAERMLPRIFRSDDPALAVPLAPETRQALERLLESPPAAVFAAPDSLGWTYQFWQAERKEAVNKSGVKIGADELPAVTKRCVRGPGDPPTWPSSPTPTESSASHPSAVSRRQPIGCGDCWARRTARTGRSRRNESS